MHRRLTARLIGILMLLTFALALAWSRTDPPITVISPIDLEALVPLKVGDWAWVPSRMLGVVNPLPDAQSKRIYTQTLTRIYVNQTNGEQMMLTLAYGPDQRDDLQVHYPEVCYPAQGFEVLSNQRAELRLPFGLLPVRQMQTRLNARRSEPVTYWAMLGETVVLGGGQKKWAEMRARLAGKRFDGLLFRVSSIDADAGHAFGEQQLFVSALLGGMAPAARHRLSGL
jgi:EpsI family protein